MNRIVEGMTFRILTAALVVMVAGPSQASAEKLRVVASTSDLAYFARQIGGELVDVDFIAAGNRDLHFIEVLPSYMLKLRKADIFLTVGLDLDTWSAPLVDGSRNSRLRVVNCAEGVAALEVPQFKADARFGDVHPHGNPHCWLSPDNVPTICRNIAAAFAQADPAHAATYQAGLDFYLARLEAKHRSWDSLKTQLSEVRFVAYHNTWPYFCAYFGCKVVGFVEEFAGVTPSPSHLAQLIDRIKTEKIPLVVYEPFHDKRVPEMLAEKTGCKAIVLPESIGGLPGTDTYEDLIDALTRTLLNAGRGTT